jgi:tetratricopeptide (TPR) repeat protein
MKKKSFLDKFGGLFSSTAQLQRIVILSGVVLVLLAGTFGAYYYYDRFYRPQPSTSEVDILQAEKDVNANPGSVEKRVILAEKYMFALKWSDALQQLALAQSAQPTDIEQQLIWLDTGIANYQLKNYEAAISPLNNFIDIRKDEDMPGLDKQLQAAAYFLGDSYIQLEQYDKAVLPLEQGVTWSRTDSDVLYKLGVAYVHIGEDQRAIEVLIGATNFVPDFLEAYQTMGLAYKNLKNEPMVVYTDGMAAYSSGEFDKALELLLKAEETTKESPYIYLGLGWTYESLGQLDNAENSFISALKLDPTNMSANSSLQRIQLLKQK